MLLTVLKLPDRLYLLSVSGLVFMTTAEILGRSIGVHVVSTVHSVNSGLTVQTVYTVHTGHTVHTVRTRTLCILCG